MQSTFVIAMSFNIKGLFKQRFYHQLYMLLSMVAYEMLIIYLLFNHDFTDMFPFMSSVNEWIRDFYLLVDYSFNVKLYVATALFLAMIGSIGGEWVLIRLFREKRKQLG